jgi:vacuolar protein sorting-associated protein 26
MFYDRGEHFEFTSVAKQLAPAGFLEGEETSFPFDFSDIEKQYESYNGINVRLR